MSFYEMTVEKRFNFLMKELGEETFKGKSIIEIGSKHGDFTKRFKKIGAGPICVADVRQDRLDTIGLDVEKQYVDIQKESPKGHYDICLFMRVLHHTMNHSQVLRNVSKCANFFVIEARVLDTKEATVAIVQGKEPPRSFSSAKFIEDTLDGLGIRYERFDDPELNMRRRNYSWKVENNWKSGPALGGQSRLWWCWKR